MFENLTLFRMAQAMGVHAGARQAIVSQNIANADTPGYKARDLPPFRELAGADATATAPRATRPGHLHGRLDGGAPRPEEVTRGTADPNGNSVSLELEMLAAVDVKREHERALAIYKSTLDILRTSIGRR